MSLYTHTLSVLFKWAGIHPKKFFYDELPKFFFVCFLSLFFGFVVRSVDFVLQSCKPGHVVAKREPQSPCAAAAS
jgi:hypothetical protein